MIVPLVFRLGIGERLPESDKILTTQRAMWFHPKFVLALLLAGGLCLPAAVSGQALPAASSPSAAPAAPSAPPDQLPTSTPQVTYSQGQLKISAQNSTLRDVLAMVRTRTGVVIEGPTNQANERVAIELGPGPVTDVLRQLLEGSKFDYVILGNAGKPGVERVILSVRGAAPAQPVAQATPANEPPEEEPIVDEPAADAGPDAQPVPPGQPVPGQPNFPGAAVQPEGVDANGQPVQQPGMQPDQNVQNPNQQADPNQPQQPKSPEELLRELQMMQQREQNQNNQSNQ
jgi:hypothetical protein